jgi:trehalose synthase
VSALEHEEVAPASLDPFRSVLGERFAAVESDVAHARELFAGRVVWHVNSTARGGGVAELLQSLLAYARGAGVDARWAVIGGEPEFFAITKRIHNLLHGSPGDGGPLGEAEREAYERTLREPARLLAELVRERDVVFLHDPQTAGMVAPVLATGATVVWRCHVGLDHPDEHARRAWDFLRPEVRDAHALVFSREAFVWDGLPKERIWIVAPSIDAFSPKNQDLDPEAVAAILGTVGLSDGAAGEDACFVRRDGTPGRVDRAADIQQSQRIPAGAPVITQVSRWDRLKDPVGVLRGFAEHAGRSQGAHLVLAGPAAEGVSDDPEGAEVLTEVLAAQAGLPVAARERTHVASLPMADLEENAAMVNAIQRRSDVIVQKSIAEGFGLTVAEAMWKARAVVASGRGGIQDQIADGETGLLLRDPEDLAAFGAALDELVADRARRDALGAAARRRVEDEFLGTRHLSQYFHLLSDLLEGRDAT